MFPELVLAVLPTLTLLPAMARVPPLMVRLFFASTATPAVKVPAPLIVKL